MFLYMLGLIFFLLLHSIRFDQSIKSCVYKTVDEITGTCKILRRVINVKQQVEVCSCFSVEFVVAHSSLYLVYMWYRVQSLMQTCGERSHIRTSSICKKCSTLAISTHLVRLFLSAYSHVFYLICLSTHIDVMFVYEMQLGLKSLLACFFTPGLPPSVESW